MRIRHQVLSSLCAGLILCLAALWLGNAPLVCAQSTNTGTIAGTVTDTTNAVVNTAMVTLTDTSTKNARSATTNDAGSYQVNPRLV